MRISLLPETLGCQKNTVPAMAYLFARYWNAVTSKKGYYHCLVSDQNLILKSFAEDTTYFGQKTWRNQVATD